MFTWLAEDEFNHPFARRSLNCPGSFVDFLSFQAFTGFKLLTVGMQILFVADFPPDWSVKLSDLVELVLSRSLLLALVLPMKRLLEA